MITDAGVWTIQAGQFFFFKGFKCRVVSSENAPNIWEVIDGVEIDGKVYYRKRYEWRKKFMTH